jgi:hypothetical protein
LTWPLEFGFHYESLMNSWTMFSKGRIVCVINLLTLFGKNKNIIDIAEFSLWINFTIVFLTFMFSLHLLRLRFIIKS